MTPQRMRFWDFVQQTPLCWLWRGPLTDKGYGYISFGRKNVGAHVVSYSIIRGPVPEGLELDHLCRIRDCVNPDHLEPVTSRTNVLRGVGPSAQNARKTHCQNGHAYDTTWVGHRSIRMRICKTCRRALSSRWLAENRKVVNQRRRKWYAAEKERVNARRRELCRLSNVAVQP